MRELADSPGVLFSGKSTLLVKVACLSKCTGCAVEWNCLRHLGNASNYSVQLSNKQNEVIRINTPRKIPIAFSLFFIVTISVNQKSCKYYSTSFL